MTRRHLDRGPITCRCGTPTPNGELTCESCLNLLDQAIADLTWLSDQLDAMVGQQHGIDTSGGGTTTDDPDGSLPFNDRASRTQRRLHHTLARWVRRIHAAGVAHQSPTVGLPRPADDPTRWAIPTMARWLAWRTDGLAHHRMGHAASTEIRSVVASTTQQVLWTGKTRTFLGPCDMHAVCGGQVWAEDDADTGICDSCGAPYPVDQRRSALEAQLDARLCTAAEIAKLSTYLGLDLNREQVRKRINLWHHRGRITPAGRDPHAGEPLFRYGDVRALLAATGPDRSHDQKTAR